VPIEVQQIAGGQHTVRFGVVRDDLPTGVEEGDADGDPIEHGVRGAPGVFEVPQVPVNGERKDGF
jgi:hypothetical protein